MDELIDVNGANYVDYVLSGLVDDLGNDLALYDPSVQPGSCSNIPKANSFQGRPSLTHQSQSSAQDESVVPSSSSQTRSYPFQVSLPSSSTSKKYLLKVEGEDRLLIVTRGFPFAVQFSFDGQPPDQSEVWAVVKCKEESDFRTLGPVHKCVKHSQTGERQFLIASNDSVTYGQWDSHQAVKVPCSSMAERDGHYTCVYECTCYSSCFVGRGPMLVIQFYLMSKDGVLLGTDVINLKSCSSIKRASGSHSGGRKIPRVDVDPQRTSEVGALKSDVPVLYEFIGDDKPDQDGYYTFTWKLKDPFIFNMLKAFRYSHQLP